MSLLVSLVDHTKELLLLLSQNLILNRLALNFNLSVYSFRPEHLGDHLRFFLAAAFYTKLCVAPPNSCSLHFHVLKSLLIEVSNLLNVYGFFN